MTESERIEKVLEHLLCPLLDNSDAYKLNIIEGKSVVMIEVSVHGDDLVKLNEGEDSLFQALQRLISVASKERKLSLELIESV